MRVVDSSGWIEYYFEGPLASLYAKHLENFKNVIIPAVVLYEVYKKMKLEKGETVAVSIAALMQQCKVIPLDEEIALLAADYSLQYKLAMADAIVYATAQREEVPLMTSDKDLKDLPGVLYHSKLD